MNFAFTLLTGLLSLLAVGLSTHLTLAEEPRSEGVKISVEVDLGQDVGQSFGSLFEARDTSGRVVAGAGFQDLYNTRFRTDRHTLQFFVRPKTGEDQFTVERLPHPDLDCGVYLFDLDGQVYAWASVRGNSVRRWDEPSGRWVSELPPFAEGIRSGDGVMRLGKGQLTFTHDTAKYNDRVILSPPEEGGYHNFYYALGHLLFYHRKTGSGAFTRLLACPWTPDDAGPIDLSDAIVLDREKPFIVLFLSGHKYPRAFFTTILYGVSNEILKQSNELGLICLDCWQSVDRYFRAVLFNCCW